MIRMRVRFLVAVLALWCLPYLAYGAPPPHWRENGFGYSATDTQLRKLLTDFARSFGVELRMSGEFPEPINGRIQGANAIEFLDRLSTLQHFQWFVYNNALYVSPTSSSIVERIEIDPESADQIKPALSGLGLFDQKFGWGELGDAGAVTVAGPSEYIRLIRQMIQKQDLRKDEFEAMVFKLKYAAVDDRKINIRDQTVVTPGIATMLKNMVTSMGPGGKRHRIALGVAGPPLPSAPTPPQLGTALQLPLGAFGPLGPTTQAPAFPGAPGTPESAAPGEAPFAPPTSGPSVIGDIRTNSIIIFDSPRKRPYYQRLIDSLDVPQKLVEIEAYIVDVNRERLAEFGADFSLGGLKNVSIGAVSTLAAGALPNTTLMVQSLGKFLIRLQMMESKGDARTLAKPSVLTLENLTAVLDMSQTVYLKATGERVAQITPVTAGTLLRVTPRTIDENGVTRIHLTVDIEDGSISAIPNSDTPEIQKSTISTQTILENQESLVIGGYDVDQSGNKVSAVPGISRVPLIGGLFSSSNASSQSRQRLFIITPRIVKTGVERDRAEAALAAESVVTLATGAMGSRLRLTQSLGSMLAAEAQAQPLVVPQPIPLLQSPTLLPTLQTQPLPQAQQPLPQAQQPLPQAQQPLPQAQQPLPQIQPLPQVRPQPPVLEIPPVPPLAPPAPPALPRERPQEQPQAGRIGPVLQLEPPVPAAP